MEEIKEKQSERVVRVFSELVGLFDSKPRSFVIVLLILYIIYQQTEIKDLNKKIVDDNKEWSKMQVQVYEKVINRIEPRINSIKQTTDSTSVRVKKTTNKTEDVLDLMVNKLGLERQVKK